jgi:hypothetical protein
MKSKYPNQIDTPSELPLVRDNITEISSDIINSIRSAVVQIEKTLGINPQGTTGQTLAERISKVIDVSGNLNADAIERAGLVFGPISDDQIADNAAISESKLRLNFPTNVIQSELSAVSNLISEIQSKINQLSALISAHVNLESNNRHNAKAISVDSISQNSSSTGIKTFNGDNLQDILSLLVSDHFNYDGSGITSDNNSHSANQIYFNNDNVSAIIDSNSVQGAIEEIAGGNDAAIRKNLSYLTKNGLARYGKTNDAFNGESFEEVLISSSALSFSISSDSITTISFDSTPSIEKEISKFDILTISGATSDLDNKSFYISEVVKSSGMLLEVKVFGKVYSSSAGTALGVITKNNFNGLNINGLNSTFRIRNGYSNTPDIVIANPNAATITSFGLRTDLITLAANAFKIQVDDYSEVTISCYNSLATIQTIDSIVSKINEQLVSNHLAAFAYKTRVKNCYELSIAHVIPNFNGDLKNRTIKISPADTDNGFDVLGFSYLEYEPSKYKTVQGSCGNSTFINGKLFRDFQKTVTLSSTEVYFGSSRAKLMSFSSNFLNLDIRAGDLVVITGSSDVQDDGLFCIKTVSESQIVLDSPIGFNFNGSLSSSSSVLILRSSAPISELNFEEVDSGTGLMMVDVFATEDSDIFYSKRLEISNVLSSLGFYAVIIDVSKEFIGLGETYYLKINSQGMAYIEDTSGNTGQQIFVGNYISTKSDSIFKVKSPDGSSFLTIRVSASNNPMTLIQTTIHGNYEVSKNSLHLSRCIFSNSTGRVFGSSLPASIPSIIDKRNFGTIDVEQICPSFVERYIEGPRNELRSCGIISGCEASITDISADDFGDYVAITVSPGVCFCSGIRIEFSGITSFKSRLDTRFYICINEVGCLEVKQQISLGSGLLIGVSPFINRSVAHLGYIDQYQNLNDLRFFINNLDGKLTHNIVVAKSDSLGHFTDIQKAVNYCSLFYQIIYGRDTDDYTYCPSILIREGEYTINSPIIIEKDITISGVGKSTVLKRGMTDCARFTSTPDPLTAIFVIGDGPGVIKTYDSSDSYSKFNFGVTIKDLTYYSPTLTTGSKTTFCLFHGENAAEESSASFTFQGISAIGAPERETDSTIKEYFLVASRISATTGEELHSLSNITKISKIFITSNFMKRIGAYQSGNISESIAVEFMNQFTVSGSPPLCDIQDIVCTSNICIGIIPTAGFDLPSILRTSFQYANILGIIEASNVRRASL